MKRPRREKLRLTGEREVPEPFTILFVCTGNICRSSLAERLSRAYFDQALGEDSVAVRSCSAGVQAVVGAGMHPDSALVLAGLGGDAAGFRAQQLVEHIAVDADLTLTMTREHRRVALQLAPRALSRTFTLREAADLSALVGAVTVEGGSFPDRARAMVERWAAARTLRAGGGRVDDVPDPIGRPLEEHQQVGDLIAEALMPVLDRLVTLRDSPDASASGRTRSTGASAGADPDPPIRAVGQVS